MYATDAIIHFIGLVLFSAQVSNDPGLHAILPAIRHEPPTHTGPTVPTTVASFPSAGPGAAHGSFSTPIESHLALLIFHKDVIADHSQWEATPILEEFPHATALASYMFVALTGEHITFIVDAPNDTPAELPANMPRLSCAKTAELTSGYQWPYSGAAAVVDIPEGTLSVCHAKNVATGRIDTKLTLNTTGTLTVVATKSGVLKTLVLNTSSSPTIYLANVPRPRVKGTDTVMTGPSHFLAYYSMIGKDQTRTCLVPPNSVGTVPDCERRRVFLTGRGGAVSTLGEFRRVGEIFSANAECSNTQWP